MENLYLNKFNTYLKEVPPNFLSFYNKRTKKEEVTKHLRKLYGVGNFTNVDVECVLKRVLNLARNSFYSREEYEDTLRQTEFRQNQWNIIKRCEICGIKFNNEFETSLEHVMPLSLGGDDNETNWQLVCKRCNHDKDSLFGISNIDRISVYVQNKLYKYQKIEEQILAVPKNYRYLVIERDNRKCCCCSNDSSTSELYVSIKDVNDMVSYDNLYTLCESCITSKGIANEYILVCNECEKMKKKNKRKQRNRV